MGEIAIDMEPVDAHQLAARPNITVGSACSFLVAMLRASRVDHATASARLVICRSCDRRGVDEIGEFCSVCGCNITGDERALRNLVAYSENLPPSRGPHWGCKHPRRGKGYGWPVPLGARPIVAPAPAPVKIAKPVEVEQPPLVFDRAGKPVGVENMFRGRSAFLILGGPSFSTIDATKLRRPGVLTMGVNNSVKSFRPDLWTCVDSPDHFLRSTWLDPRIIKIVPEKLKRSRVFDSTTWSYAEETVSECPATFFFRRHCGFNAASFLTEETICWGNDNNNGGGRSVMLVAIRLLYFLGVRRIFLLGCDFKMDTGYAYHFEQARAPGSVKGNNSTYATLCKRFTEARPYFEAAGLEILNCNPDSGLRAFDFCTLDKALDLVAGEFGKIDVTTERTSDLYDTKKPPMKKPVPQSAFWMEAPPIPKRAHFVWLGSPLPEVAAQLLDGFKRLHPAWSVNLITAPPPDMDADLRRAFDSCAQICQQADLLRLDALRREGGFAFDVDFVWLRPLDELCHFDHFVSQGTDSRLFNGAVGFAKDSAALASVLSIARDTARTGPPYERTAFGPRLFSRARDLGKPEINIAPKHYFYPFYKHDTAVGFLRADAPARDAMISDHQARYVDGVWPFAVQLFGFPADKMPTGAGRSSWTAVALKGKAL